MEASDIVLWFSVVVTVLVAVWGFLMIRAFNKTED